LADEAGVGQHLGQRVARSDLRVDVLELLGGDLAALDEDRPELVARVVRGAEQDPARSEIQRLVVRGPLDLQRAGRASTMELDDDEGESLGIDLTAEGERFGQGASRRFMQNRGRGNRQIVRNDNTMD